MSLKINGKITKVLEVESGKSKAGKDWQKQTFVIDTGDQYNPLVAFSLFGSEKIENFAKYNKVGDEVEVSFNVSSREFKDKYYHSLDAWKVFKANAETKQEEAVDSDDLPF
jgi:hypothetical protein